MSSSEHESFSNSSNFKGVRPNASFEAAAKQRTNAVRHSIGLRNLEDIQLCGVNEKRLPELAAVRRFIKMVGTTGFEPATSRTPSVRATRLRHVPLRTSSIRAKS